MLIIGELINCTRKKVGEAAEKRDEEFFLDLARKQASAGAHMLDVNGGLPQQEVELLSWLVDLVQGVVDIPLCLDSADPEALMQALKDKQPFVNYMVTQICFDPQIIGKWLADVRANGIILPVYIGIPGILKRSKLLEISLRVGVGDSTRFLKNHLGMVARLLQHDMYTPDKLVKKITGLTRDQVVAGFHIYTFNQCLSTKNWREKALKHYRTM